MSQAVVCGGGSAMHEGGRRWRRPRLNHIIRKMINKEKNGRRWRWTIFHILNIRYCRASRETSCRNYYLIILQKPKTIVWSRSRWCPPAYAVIQFTIYGADAETKQWSDITQRIQTIAMNAIRIECAEKWRNMYKLQMKRLRALTHWHLIHKSVRFTPF